MMNQNKSKLQEPPQLKRGKVFQKLVQDDYSLNSQGGGVEIEKEVNYKGTKKRLKHGYGRMDIIVQDYENDYVMIMEIKATDWDKIKSKNIIRNLYRHGRQLHKYIDKYLEVDNFTVGLALIYPEPPLKEGLREFVEKQAMDRYSFPVYWYSEINSAKTEI